mmetsp:Transcript_155324/g.289775  ORF Transcript_155324/g.289775 Transcript_155324/m.289775 type:complete len:110 (-) Transcript_155324:2089-2418(-)
MLKRSFGSRGTAGTWSCDRLAPLGVLDLEPEERVGAERLRTAAGESAGNWSSMEKRRDCVLDGTPPGELENPVRPGVDVTMDVTDCFFAAFAFTLSTFRSSSVNAFEET